MSRKLGFQPEFPERLRPHRDVYQISRERTPEGRNSCLISCPYRSEISFSDPRKRGFGPKWTQIRLRNHTWVDLTPSEPRSTRSFRKRSSPSAAAWLMLRRWFPHESQRRLGEDFYRRWEEDTFRGTYLEAVPKYRGTVGSASVV